MHTQYLYLIQILFIAGLSLGSKGILEDKLKWSHVARYIIYILSIKLVPVICTLVHDHCSNTTSVLQTWAKFIEYARPYAVFYCTSVAVVVYFDDKLFREDFVYVFLAFLIVQYSEMSTTKKDITYGVGMACSYFEGYLVNVIPSDGAKFVGFEENITALENRHGILFPVKKLFIVITTSLYCPPDLKDFNKSKDVCYLESMGSLEDVIKNVAGVKNRQYRNTAYKIIQPGSAYLSPVCLVAECATPLHTLHKVVNNRTLYDEMRDIDVPSVVADFTTTLKNIIDKSPHCKGKCELVLFDPDDPSQNLADILLDRIRELVPKFEEKIEARRLQNLLT